MSNSRIRYTNKFKRDAVSRVLMKGGLGEVADDLKISRGLLQRWVKAAKPKAAAKKGVSLSEAEAAVPLVDAGGPLVEANPESVSLGQATPHVALEMQLDRVTCQLKLSEQANEHLQRTLREAKQELNHLVVEYKEERKRLIKQRRQLISLTQELTNENMVLDDENRQLAQDSNDRTCAP